MILCFEHNCLVEPYTKRRVFAQNVAFVSIETYKREKNIKDNSPLKFHDLGLNWQMQIANFLNVSIFKPNTDLFSWIYWLRCTIWIRIYDYILNRITIDAWSVYVTTDSSFGATYMDTTKLFERLCNESFCRTLNSYVENPKQSGSCKVGHLNSEIFSVSNLIFWIESSMWNDNAAVLLFSLWL